MHRLGTVDAGYAFAAVPLSFMSQVGQETAAFHLYVPNRPDTARRLDYPMHRTTKFIAHCFIFAVVSLAAQQLLYCQQPSTTEPPPMVLLTPARILESFLKTEAQLRETLKQYTFKRDVVLQTIGPTGAVTGQYVRNSEFVFDNKGNRVERVTYHPPSTIREMRITKEDIQDLAGAQLLGIDIFESAKYQLSYAGSEFLSGNRVYHIVVEPALKPNPFRMRERFFRGSIWIDSTTFQIVKVKGIVEPQGKQRFPIFETWREPVTPSLYFATRTEADVVLHFPHRDVNYRIRVRYYDYKLFASTVSVKEIEEPITDKRP